MSTMLDIAEAVGDKLMSGTTPAAHRARTAGNKTVIMNTEMVDTIGNDA